MATGYIGGGEKAPLIDLGWYAPTGQMYSTVNDLLKVALTLYLLLYPAALTLYLLLHPAALLYLS